MADDALARRPLRVARPGNDGGGGGGGGRRIDGGGSSGDGNDSGGDGCESGSGDSGAGGAFGMASSVRAPSALSRRVSCNGSWNGPTAGGSPNHATFAKNPQFALYVYARKVTLSLSLSIRGGARGKTPVDAKPALGLAVLDVGGRRVSELLKEHLVAATDVYLAESTVTLADLVLPAAPLPYTVVASTFDPGVNARFVLTASLVSGAEDDIALVKISPPRQDALQLALTSLSGRDWTADESIELVPARAAARTGAAGSALALGLMANQPSPPLTPCWRLLVRSSWIGRSAGGCLNFASGPWSPQYLLRVTTTVQLTVALRQTGSARLWPIQLVLADTNGERAVTLRETDIIADSGPHVARACVSFGPLTVYGSADSLYTVLVSAFAPGDEACFTLAVDAAIAAGGSAATPPPPSPPPLRRLAARDADAESAVTSVGPSPISLTRAASPEIERRDDSDELDNENVQKDSARAARDSRGLFGTPLNHAGRAPAHLLERPPRGTVLTSQSSANIRGWCDREFPPPSGWLLFPYESGSPVRASLAIDLDYERSIGIASNVVASRPLVLARPSPHSAWLDEWHTAGWAAALDALDAVAPATIDRIVVLASDCSVARVLLYVPTPGAHPADLGWRAVLVDTTLPPAAIEALAIESDASFTADGASWRAAQLRWAAPARALAASGAALTDWQWRALLVQKAVAKTAVSLPTLWGAPPHIALAALTGGLPERVLLLDEELQGRGRAALASLWARLVSLFTDGCVALAQQTRDGTTVPLLRVAAVDTLEMVAVDDPSAARKLTRAIPLDDEDDPVLARAAAAASHGVAELGPGAVWIEIKDFANAYAAVFAVRLLAGASWLCSGAAEVEATRAEHDLAPHPPHATQVPSSAKSDPLTALVSAQLTVPVAVTSTVLIAVERAHVALVRSDGGDSGGGGGGGSGGGGGDGTGGSLGGGAAAASASASVASPSALLASSQFAFQFVLAAPDNGGSMPLAAAVRTHPTLGGAAFADSGALTAESAKSWRGSLQSADEPYALVIRGVGLGGTAPAAAEPFAVRIFTCVNESDDRVATRAVDVCSLAGSSLTNGTLPPARLQRGNQGERALQGESAMPVRSAQLAANSHGGGSEAISALLLRILVRSRLALDLAAEVAKTESDNTRAKLARAVETPGGEAVHETERTVGAVAKARSVRSPIPARQSGRTTDRGSELAVGSAAITGASAGAGASASVGASAGSSANPGAGAGAGAGSQATKRNARARAGQASVSSDDESSGASASGSDGESAQRTRRAHSKLMRAGRPGAALYTIFEDESDSANVTTSAIAMVTLRPGTASSALGSRDQTGGAGAVAGASSAGAAVGADSSATMTVSLSRIAKSATAAALGGYGLGSKPRTGNVVLPPGAHARALDAISAIQDESSREAVNEQATAARRRARARRSREHSADSSESVASGTPRLRASKSLYLRRHRQRMRQGLEGLDEEARLLQRSRQLVATLRAPGLGGPPQAKLLTRTERLRAEQRAHLLLQQQLLGHLSVGRPRDQNDRDELTPQAPAPPPLPSLSPGSGEPVSPETWRALPRTERARLVADERAHKLALRSRRRQRRLAAQALRAEIVARDDVRRTRASLQPLMRRAAAATPPPELWDVKNAVKALMGAPRALSYSPPSVASRRQGTARDQAMHWGIMRAFPLPPLAATAEPSALAHNSGELNAPALRTVRERAASTGRTRPGANQGGSSGHNLVAPPPLFDTSASRSSFTLSVGSRSSSRTGSTDRTSSSTEYSVSGPGSNDDDRDRDRDDGGGVSGSGSGPGSGSGSAAVVAQLVPPPPLRTRARLPRISS